MRLKVGLCGSVVVLVCLGALFFEDLPFAPVAVNRATMERVEERVVEIRGLDFQWPFERQIMSRQAWRAIARRHLSAIEEGELDGYIIALAAFDMLDADTGVSDFSVSMAGWYGNVGGVYAPRYVDPYVSPFDQQSSREIIIIVSDRIYMGPEEERVYAHEVTHHLQYRHFGVRVGSTCTFLDFRDRCLADKALREGDAELVRGMYGDVNSSGGGTNREKPGWSEMEPEPNCLLAQLSFPYTYGRVFVEALYEKGGWDAVNAAYTDQPRSTEHILHPDRYLAGEMPRRVSVPSLSRVLGPGWHSASGGVLGEYGVRCYLAQQISNEEATAAAEGWGGDRYRVYYREGGEVVLAFQTVWDTPADAEEFADAYTAYAEARFGHGAASADVGRTCWQGEDHLCLRWEGDEAVVVLGPDAETVEAVYGKLWAVGTD